MKNASLISLLLVFLPVLSIGQEPELNEMLMRTTFFVQGPAKTGSTTSGTAFLLLRPFSVQPDPKTVIGRPVLVTAAHVLDEMAGDTADIALRTQQIGTEHWTMRPARLAIRRGGVPLWKQLPNIDVAVMYVKWPSMRRPVGVKWILLFFRWTRFFSRRVATVATLPSALFVSDRFARCKLGVLVSAGAATC